MKRHHSFLSAHVFALILVFSFFTTVTAQKLPADEIVVKHLDSIGTNEARKNMKNHIAAGTIQFKILRQGGTAGDGKIVLASEGNKMLLGMTFNIGAYPAETIVFDGKNSKVAFVTDNIRSPFGDFIFRYSDIIEEGLLSGTLSSAWGLTNLTSRKAKVENNATKKINGREAYVLSYLPKGGSDLLITIFIDKQNFQHLRTEYRHVISAQQGATPNASAQKREQRQTLIEDFSNYKKENGLNLPHNYRAYLLFEGGSETREYEWKAEFSQFFLNQPIDPNSFNTKGK